MSPKGILVAGLCLFACLYAAVLLMRTDAIENDLAERATQVLTENGFDTVRVEVDGRDVTLAGAARESKVADALGLVATVWGVRVVASDIDTVAAEQAYQAEQARAEATRVAEQARIEARKAEAARLAEQARHAEAARSAEQARLQGARKSEAVHLASQARLAHETTTATRQVTARLVHTKQVAEQTLESPQAAAPVAQSASENCHTSIREFLAGKTIEFNTGSAGISSDDVKLLDAMSASVRECPQVQIEIIGHTDARGEPQANLDLSWRRAEAAVTALARAGVTRGSLSATGYGSAAPLASNATAEGRARNRRIEFHVKQ